MQPLLKNLLWTLILDRVSAVLEIREKSGKMRKGCNLQGKVREFEKRKRKVSEGSGNFDSLFQRKSSSLVNFKLMVSAAAKMLYREVMENFLRSGKSQGKVRENESREKVDTLLGQSANDVTL